MCLEDKILEALKSVYDPELSINVVDLGLIYQINISDEKDVTINMTLTTPGCPLHNSITSGVRHCVEAIEEVKNVKVNLVWQPAWSPDKMTDEGRRALSR
ncbi:metal-sulfur cluster assembly factor [Neobacillus thermocopriae]|uniref:Metal-sulfur cluster assembly factor n=1 Tax=Neobacillus thermocopriae TaxID=1215031 RepID=A0A6B3TQB2_9BACI|nr:metal-sulfur cluster assembly factor [Neobacillus thermocopriae]MED3625039.1 metal-sulfur cluster assembly factor [Neobacillus thermocopriae]MED3712763.1 metal-sulfur cluster assembly factor [Neobacillus thermocopriae]NEX79003.1 metal-sulfur cluster assembly factor [Neobacillus thermocopriae]